MSGLALRGHPLHTRSLTIVLRQGEDGATLAREAIDSGRALEVLNAMRDASHELKKRTVEK